MAVKKVKKNNISLKKEAYILYNGKTLLVGNGKEFQEINEDELYNFLLLNNISKVIGFNLKKVIKILITHDLKLSALKSYRFEDIKLAWYVIDHTLTLTSIEDLAKHLDLYTIHEIYKKTMYTVNNNAVQETT